jgi:hypothetical protein
MTLKLCYQNLVDTAVITASSEEAGLPASNVTTFHKSKVWRATGCAAEWIKFDFGSAQDITEILIVGHNFSSGATVQVELNASDAWGTPTVQESIVWHGDIMLIEFDSAQNFQWGRVTIADGSNPDGYVQAGRIYFGGAISPERDFIVGWSVDEVDPSEMDKAGNGAYSIDEKTPYLLFTLPFVNTLLDNVKAVWDDRKLTGELFIICDYSNALATDGRHDYSRYVKFADKFNPAHRYGKRYDFTLVFEELIG